ncbi:hypothetical protein ACQKWADRAFT_287438 [Trichoderma austrokoningii]
MGLVSSSILLYSTALGANQATSHSRPCCSCQWGIASCQIQRGVGAPPSVISRLHTKRVLSYAYSSEEVGIRQSFTGGGLHTCSDKLCDTHKTAVPVCTHDSKQNNKERPSSCQSAIIALRNRR